MAPNPDDACYWALIEVSFPEGSKCSAFAPGAFVHVWTFAPTEAQARTKIREACLTEFESKDVKFQDIGPGDPTDLTEGGGQNLRELFTDSPVVFGTKFTWRRKRWWEFWRKPN